MIYKARHRRHTYYIYLLLACFIMAMIAGCSNELKRFIRKDADLSNVKTIAVMPIENFTSEKYAAEKIRSVVMIDLLSRGINVVEPGEVVSVMRMLKIWSVSRMSIEDIRNMGRMLGVDAFITGAVETYGISRGISVSYPEVAVSFTLVESQSGKTLWSVWHTAGGADFWTRHFGTEGRTLDEASRQVIKEAFDTLY